MVLRDAARRAIGEERGGILQLPLPERAGAFALATIVAPGTATTLLEGALDAAGAKERATFNAMLEAVRTDAALLDQKFSPVMLAGSKLWPGETPDWAQQLWSELKHELLSENEGWDVWTQWYDARLSGELSSDQIELRWAAIPDDVWEHELGSVNRALQAIAVTHEDTSEPDVLFAPAVRQTIQLGGLQKVVQAVGQAGTIISQSGVTATAEVISNPVIEAVVARIKSDPRQFEEIARFAARSIDTELKQLATKIPNEPDAHAGYAEVRAVLQRLQAGFEKLAAAVHESTEVADPVEQSTLLRSAVQAAQAMTEGFVGWLNENGNTAGRVIAQLGLAGVISGTLSYFVGIPPVLSFSVTAAALSGNSIWDAIVLLASQKKGGAKGD